MNKYMNKISSITLTFVFILSFVGVSLLSPQKASAALNESQLTTKVSTILKLEAMARCVQDKLNSDGIKAGSGPFNEGFLSTGGATVKVGHIVEQQYGDWDCEDGKSSRQDAWFKLLLVNGSDSKRYTGWYSGDNPYAGPSTGNLKKNDNSLYFINRNNVPNYTYKESDGFLTGKTGGPAKAKVKDQINASIKKQNEGVSDDEKKAMTYLNYSAAFVKGCGAKIVTNVYGSNSDTVTIGDKTYTVNDDNGTASVGYGTHGVEDGEQSCVNIGNRMSNNYAAYAKVTGNKDQIPPGIANSDSGSTTGGADDSCEGQSGVTGWFGCPIINIIGSTTTWIDDQVQNLMVLQPNQYKENAGLKSAWTGFRNIALSLLVAAMMIIVISTALGLSFLDAYTVKKAFPKLIASIIFILLSWWLCILLIDVTTSIGQGLLGIMQAPFGNIGNENISTLFKVDGADGALQGGVLFVGAVSIFATSGALGIVGTWLGGALLVLLMAFVTLIARQMFIIVLILFAPLAILAWIFPGSAKAWQFWWSNFTKLLLMYPMVMALIGAGRIFAFSAAGAFTGLYGTIIKLTAYVIPYALIPFTFKAAGGVFGAVASKIQDTGRPGLDKLRKRRQQGYAQMGRDAKTGDLIRSGRYGQSISAGLNRGVSGLATGTRGRFGIGTKGNEARKRNLSNISGDAAKDPAFQNFLTRDGEAATVSALSGGTTAGGREAVNDLVRGQMETFDRQNPGATAQARDEFEATQTARFNRAYQAAAVQGFSKTNSAAAIANMGANKGMGIANGDVGSFERGIARMGGSALEQEDLRGAAAFSLRGAQRMDIGGGLGDAAANPDTYRARRNAYKDTSKRVGAAAMVTNAESAAATRDIVRTDAARVATMDPTMLDEDRADSFTFGHELITGLYQGSLGESRDEAIGMLQDLGIDPDLGQPAVTEMLANHFGYTTDPSRAGRMSILSNGRVAELIDPTMRSRTSSQPTTSDRRLKKEIKYFYTNDSGIKVYRYKYLWSEVEYVGVIAQEIAKQYPEAVTVDKWGYYKVYYSRIDIDFITYAEFKKRSSVVISSEIKS